MIKISIELEPINYTLRIYGQEKKKRLSYKLTIEIEDINTLSDPAFHLLKQFLKKILEQIKIDTPWPAHIELLELLEQEK